MSNKHRNKKLSSINTETELSLPMPFKVKEDILILLNKSIEILRIVPINTPLIEILSTNTIHNTSIYQDKDSMNISIVLYSLYKLFSFSMISDSQKNKILSQLKKLQESLINNDYKTYRLEMRLLIKYLSRVNKKFSQYVQDVMDKARVKKGSDLYRHGISIGMIADLFGTSEWEVMSYVGKTNINDEIIATDAISRFKATRDFFGV